MEKSLSKKALWPALLVLLLTGCLGMESHIVLNDDGSGTLTLKYRIDRTLQDLPGAEGTASALPIPVTREDFERTVAEIEGLELLSYRRSDDDQGATVEAALRFARIADLGVEGMSLESEGGSRVFRQTLFTPRAEGGAEEDSLGLVDSLLGDAGIVITVEVPSPIRSASLGEVPAGGKRVVFQSTVADLVRGENQKVLEVVW